MTLHLNRGSGRFFREIQRTLIFLFVFFLVFLNSTSYCTTWLVFPNMEIANVDQGSGNPGAKLLRIELKRKHAHVCCACSHREKSRHECIDLRMCVRRIQKCESFVR